MNKSLTELTNDLFTFNLEEIKNLEVSELEIDDKDKKYIVIWKNVAIECVNSNNEQYCIDIFNNQIRDILSHALDGSQITTIFKKINFNIIFEFLKTKINESPNNVVTNLPKNVVMELKKIKEILIIIYKIYPRNKSLFKNDKNIELNTENLENLKQNIENLKQKMNLKQKTPWRYGGNSRKTKFKRTNKKLNKFKRTNKKLKKIKVYMGGFFDPVTITFVILLIQFFATIFQSMNERETQPNKSERNTEQNNHEQETEQNKSEQETKKQNPEQKTKKQNNITGSLELLDGLLKFAV